MIENRGRYFFVALIFILLFSDEMNAQENSEDDVFANYAYAVIFGTGVYNVNEQTAFIVHIPISYKIRDVSLEQSGLKLLLPILAGYYDYDYDKAIYGETPGEAATTGFVPGFELEYAISDYWHIKPHLQFGFGRDLQNHVYTFVYSGGVTSNYKIPSDGDWRFTIGSKFIYAGHEPEGESGETIGVVALGIDSIYPWGISIFGKEITVTNYLLYNWYVDSPNFLSGTNYTDNVSGEFEWGVALGFERPPVILGLKLERIGLGFRYGDDIKGIRLITRFPF